MSKHFYGGVAQEVHHIVNDINSMDVDTIKQIHGIELNEDGSVFDPVYNLRFDGIIEWAEFSVNEDNTEYSENMHHDDDWM